MSSSILAPPPYQSPPVTPQGMISPIWSNWISQLYVRVGQGVAPTNAGILNPMTTLGDLSYGGSSGIPTRLAGNASVTRKYLGETGTGASASAPTLTQPNFSELAGSVNLATQVSGNLSIGNLNSNYASAYFASTATWARTSASFGDPVNATSDALTSLISNGITLTPAASSKLGVSFTPASASSIYLVTAYINLSSAATWVAGKLWDGTTLIAYGNTNPLVLTGLYAPGTSGAVNLTVQLASATGSVTAQDATGITTPAMFTVLQIK